ncbi:hypothetical protein BCR42DRAFT_339335 [Absidia repens]|uniref:Uncharacterized protein n=1 Tax=Absidia repens TaxID=90262 RepID=A0A1X2HK80_9FUNG|nr:hypothetical protein BCR42DRAFT_339335 [Absidia repens]
MYPFFFFLFFRVWVGKIEALAGSMVKIKAKDVLATWKIIVAAFAAPALYGFYSLIYFLYLVKRRPSMSTHSKMIRSCALWAIQPILHYFLMRLGDTGLDIYKSIGPLFLAVRNPAVGKLLREMRKNLSHDITEFVNQHIDIILPNDERQERREEEAIDFSIPDTQDIEVDQEIINTEALQQQQAMESVVLMVDGDEEQQSQTIPGSAASITVSSGQSVEAY